MKCINRIELLDHIRQDLISQGREGEADTIDNKTTREGLCDLLGLPPKTTTWKSLREKYGLTFKRRALCGYRSSIQCYLVDVPTGESMCLSSCGRLSSYLECFAQDSSIETLAGLIRQGGCLISHRGREKYLVPRVDTCFAPLPRCKVRSLLIRLEAQHQLGLPVETYSTCRSILNKVPVVGDMESGYKRVLYNYFGRGEEYENCLGGDGYKPPSATILYSPDNVHIFMSRLAAASFLRISERALEFLARGRISCPYRGVYYRIEL